MATEVILENEVTFLEISELLKLKTSDVTQVLLVEPNLIAVDGARVIAGFLKTHPSLEVLGLDKNRW